MLRRATVPEAFWEFGIDSPELLHVLQLQAKQINTWFDLIGIHNERLANRVGLHLALGGGFEPPPTP